ncbi:exonuclease V [Apiospora rasikravindrae]|uniref:Exonuclease V n=1 Tax=Apiospora rasikravindrae TaxID=990691 RepID=A0ABR1U1B8_9PEZI
MSSNIPPSEDDYGSDFSLGEESLVIQLLDGLQPNPTETRATANPTRQLTAEIATPLLPEKRSFDDASFQDAPQHRPATVGQARTPAAMRDNMSRAALHESWQMASMPLDGINYPDLSRALSDLPPQNTAQSTANEPADDNLRKPQSPVERFRSFPRRPLTVTDLSSGAWCELQYWYTLTTLPGGKKTRTAAMRGGTKVHQTLEDQVHTTVQVQITSKEEAFALRLWNIIQGLRTLRDTGFTRELEVWGIVNGHFVNGVIDEISYTNPNAEFGQDLSSQDQNVQQSSIKTYFGSGQRQVYLTDVKTRGSATLPSGAAIRPAKVQLFLYHRLLSDMAAIKLDFATVFNRYGLRADVRFSDAFMAEIGTLHDEVFYDADSDLESNASQSNPSGLASNSHGHYPDASPNLEPTMSPPPDLIRYRTLRQIVPLLQSELQATFPQGRKSMGDLLSVQYRHRSDGHIIGNQVFPADSEALNKYLDYNLAWWQGQREPDGVAIEETYKCRTCEFAESCQWRKDKEAEVLSRARHRVAARASS